ncbi:MAG: hypothetical protein ACE5KI_04575 [Dehalococcoidia bacterium]
MCHARTIAQQEVTGAAEECHRLVVLAHFRLPLGPAEEVAGLRQERIVG